MSFIVATIQLFADYLISDVRHGGDDAPSAANLTVSANASDGEGGR